MISGAHMVICTKNPEVYRGFFRDILGLKSVDAGHLCAAAAIRRHSINAVA
jgi:hypothetical protein